jgi:hypothetical protein
MTRFSFSGLKAITICAGLSMTATFALAGDGNVSAEQILNALQPKPPMRGLSIGARPPQIDPEVKAKQASCDGTAITLQLFEARSRRRRLPAQT